MLQSTEGEKCAHARIDADSCTFELKPLCLANFEANQSAPIEGPPATASVGHCLSRGRTLGLVFLLVLRADRLVPHSPASLPRGDCLLTLLTAAAQGRRSGVPLGLWAAWVLFLAAGGGIALCLQRPRPARSFRLRTQRHTASRPAGGASARVLGVGLFLGGAGHPVVFQCGGGLVDPARGVGSCCGPRPVFLSRCRRCCCRACRPLLRP